MTTAAVAELRSSVRRFALTRWSLTFASVAIAGIALRVWVYRSELGVPHADEAIVGLMARHALEHGQLTVFYWGGAYGGTQEALLAVPIFAVFGSTWLALRIVPILLSALASLLIWRTGRRTIGEPAASVAAGVFWIWPAFNLYQLTHANAFYASDVVYCALLLLLGLRVVERPDRVRVGVFALVLGLAFWQTTQLVPVAAPIVAWTIWKRPRALRELWLAVPLFVLGALPWFVWNLRHDWQSLVQPPYGDYTLSLRLLASPSLPMMIGLRAPFSTELLLPSAPLTYLVYLALIGLFVYGAIRTRRRTVSILYFTAAVFPFIYALSAKTVLALGIPRYTTVLTPVLALLVSQLATTFRRALVILALAGVVSVVTLDRMDAWFRDTPRKTTNAIGLGPRHAVQWVPRDLTPLSSTLERLGVTHVYANYWLAYRLDFDTREHVVAVESTFEKVAFEHGQAVPASDPPVRYPAYAREIRRARHGFVFFRQILDTIPIVPALERHGYRRHDVGSYVVYVPARARGSG